MSTTSDQNPVLPYIVAPTYSWDGDDGNWSTFALEVGTPPQSFRVLPATVGEEVWIPVTGSCVGPLQDISDCGTLRGANAFQNQPSRGFLPNKSSTWSALGGSVYVLSTEQNLFGSSDDGLYGQDAVALGSLTGDGYGQKIANQTVAGITTEDFWLGNIGLGTAAGSFPGDSSSIPSLLVSMKAQNLSSSLSYGYTAGQSYASPEVPGSLILGGYDGARIGSNAISIPINATGKPQQLELTIQSIVATNTLGGSTVSLLTSPIVANVDSSVSQIWLPDQACQYAAQAFGLILDPATDLFLVNNTIHKQLQTNNPSVTFTVGGVNGGPSTTIQMQYNAFDLSAGIPLYNSSTPYFPLKRAANASQITLGRTFLQEAYIIVDWERSNFTIGQAVAQNSTTEIIPILPPSAAHSTVPSGEPNSSETPSASSGLQSGAIAGIVVALIVVLAGLAGFGWYFFRRRRRNAQRRKHGHRDNDGAAPEVTFGVHEHYPDEKAAGWKSPHVDISEVPLTSSGMAVVPNEFYHKPTELANTEVHELPDALDLVRIQADRELMGTPIMELEGERVGSELDVSRTDNLSRPAVPHRESDGTVSAMSAPESGSQRPHLHHRESDGTVSIMSPPESRPQSPGVRSSMLSGNTVVEGMQSPKSDPWSSTFQEEE